LEKKEAELTKELNKSREEKIQNEMTNETKAKNEV